MNKGNHPYPISKVLFSHYRVANDDALTLPRKGRPPFVFPYRKGWTAWRPHPKGGKTVCIVVLDDGHEVMGEANCSMSDTFCYRIGRNIAYGRALKKLGDVS